jgi:hypothetical protein
MRDAPVVGFLTRMNGLDSYERLSCGGVGLGSHPGSLPTRLLMAGCATVYALGLVLIASVYIGFAVADGRWVVSLVSALPGRSWDLDLTDAADRRALGDVVGKQPERLLFGVRVNSPPDRVPAGAARGQGRTVAKRAVESFERGEDDAALVRLVAVLKQIPRHRSSLPRSGCADIGASP